MAPSLLVFTSSTKPSGMMVFDEQIKCTLSRFCHLIKVLAAEDVLRCVCVCVCVCVFVRDRPCRSVYA